MLTKNKSTLLAFLLEITLNKASEQILGKVPFLKNKTFKLILRFVIPGGMQDFNYLFSNGIELTFEMSCCKYPKVEKLKEEWDNNRQSILAFMEMVHMGIRGIVTSRTTGKPIQGLFLLQYFFSIFHVFCLLHIDLCL